MTDPFEPDDDIDDLFNDASHSDAPDDGCDWCGAPGASDHGGAFSICESCSDSMYGF